MTPLIEHLRRQLVATGCRRWLIGFSGGLDSTVLLHLCHALRDSFQFRAIHINHQLQSVALDWEQHCAQQAQALAIPLLVQRVDLKNSSEEAAREARYQAFIESLHADEGLLLAQHAGDQTETLLQRLLRGAGVKGLAGMPVQRELEGHCLLRPLLSIEREQLKRWATEQQWVWVEDPTNHESVYTRNWLRNEIVPRLKLRYPQLDKTAQRLTAQMQATETLLLERAQEDASVLEEAACQLNLTGGMQLSPERRHNLLHYWLRHYTDKALGSDTLNAIEREVLQAGQDRQPEYYLNGWVLKRYRATLYLLPESISTPELPHKLHLLASSEMPETYNVQGISVQSGKQGLKAGCYRLTQRQGGERLRPQNRGGSVTLKQLLQESGVPPWQRNDWPILWHQDEIVAVPGICICENWVADQGFHLDWVPFGLSDRPRFGRL